MLIIAIILLGMIAGAGAQLLLQRDGGINWPLAFVTGIIGSFVGGLFFSFITGHGLELHLSGIIGSIFGATLVTLIWDWFQKRRGPDAAAGPPPGPRPPRPPRVLSGARPARSHGIRRPSPRPPPALRCVACSSSQSSCSACSSAPQPS